MPSIRSTRPTSRHVAPALLAQLLLVAPAFPHPGDLDGNGGHVDRRTELYHYHRAPGESVALPAPSAKPGSADPLDVLVDARQFVGKCTKVIDGDSISVMRPVEGGSVGTELRLAGIDAPETGQAGAAAARSHLADELLQRVVFVDVRGSDGVGVVGDVYLEDGTLVNEQMVELGLAWYFAPRDPDDEALRALQEKARAAGSGLWAAPGAAPPWERASAEATDDGHLALWPALGMPIPEPELPEESEEPAPRATQPPGARAAARAARAEAAVRRAMAKLEADILRMEVELKAGDEEAGRKTAAVDAKLRGPMTNADRRRLEAERERIVAARTRDRLPKERLLAAHRERLEVLRARHPDIDVQTSTGETPAPTPSAGGSLP